jgi:hypothetical protein
MRSQGFDDARSDRKIGHKMAVHDIDVDPVRTGGVNRPNFFAEFGKVGRQD